MAKYELNIYGQNDEIVKEYKTNVCPYGVFVHACEVQEEIENKPVKEQIGLISEVLKMTFSDLTDEELMHADTGDVMSTFYQIVQGGQKFTPSTGKNK